MESYDIVKRIIGSIEPIGCSSVDNHRFENLQETTGLIKKLIDDVWEIVPLKNRDEYSLKRAGEFAQKFFDNLRTEE